MKILVFNHATDLHYDTSITLGQVQLFEKSGLLDEAYDVNMMLHYHENSFKWLEERWEKRENVAFHLFDDWYQPWYEYTSAYHIQELCNASDEEFYILYTHAKGNFTRTAPNVNWRNYMNYWCIERWRDCVAKLDEGYDLVGAGFLNNPPYPYFAGNFFWTRASYIRRCQKLIQPTENDFKPQFEGQPHLRYDLECWHGSGNPKWFDLHPGEHERWYLPPETYRKDKEDFWIYRTA